VPLTALALLLSSRQYDVRYLQHWRLSRQRKHLADSDPGSDRCVPQAGLANRFLHPGGSRLIKDVPFLIFTLIERTLRCYAAIR